MPIIGQVGRRSMKVRILNITIHVVLLIGAVTMIYPFMLMVSSSFKSRLDADKFSLWPRYFFDDEMLYKKYIEARYNEETGQFMDAWHFRFMTFDDVRFPTAEERSAGRYADWQAFLDEHADGHDIFDFQISEQYAFGVSPRNERAFRNMLKDISDDNLDVLNQKFKENVLTWEQIRTEEKSVMHRRFTGDYQGVQKQYLEFRQDLPRWHRTYVSLDGFFATNELRPAYKSSLEQMNKALGTDYPAWNRVVLSRKVPEDSPLRRHWVNLVTDGLNVQLIDLVPEAVEVYRQYLRNKYADDIAALNTAYGEDYTSFDKIGLPRDLPRSGAMLSDLIGFVEESGKREDYQRAYREFLARRYKDVAKLNQAYGTDYRSFGRVPLPEQDMPASGPLRDDYIAFAKRDAPMEMLEEAWQGFLETRYESVEQINARWKAEYVTIEKIRMPLVHPAMIDDLAAFLAKPGNTLPGKELPIEARRQELAKLTARFRDELESKYKDVKTLNEAWGTGLRSIDGELGVHVPMMVSEMVDDLVAFFASAPVPGSLAYTPAPEVFRIDSVEFQYRDWLKAKYKGDLAALNKAHDMGFASIDEVPMDLDLPEYNVAWQQRWTQFVRTKAPESALGLKRGNAQQAWQEFVKEKYPQLMAPVEQDETGKDLPRILDVDAYNRFFGTSYRQAVDIYPAATVPDNKTEAEAWLTFFRGKAPAQFLELSVADDLAHNNLTTDWHDYLREAYGGDVNQLNLSWGQVYDSFETVPLDTWLVDTNIFEAHRGDIKWEFIKRNYLMVFDVMWYNGRAILNTVIYCALSIAAALLINPIAAYALSRFKLPTTYKIILVLMLTMAFPPMVMGIPNFLMLKRLNMLNTFWALVLPAAANGYFIFLLKGFFDSLPEELFECATLDGASEVFIFWNVAMALSKPIMAVVALRAFNQAYRNFMLAFIVCQDRSMWTMMVHIYQLGQRSSMGVKFAALVIAAIPTFIVFVFCQKIIIRGIVVPTEK